MMAGVFALAGARLETGPGGDPWDTPSPTRRFAVQLHRYAWLPDLLAQGEDGAREALRLFLDWRRLFGRLEGFAWGTEVLERRVFNVAIGARAMAAAASDAEAALLADSLAVQARRLARAEVGAARRAERLAASAVAACALAGPAGARGLGETLPRLVEVLAEAVAPDGGCKTRSPEQGLELLFDLLALDDGLLQRGRETPEAVSRAIDRLTGAVRFFTLGDGRLASFQGGEAVSAERIAAALAREESAGRAYSYLPQSGYHRLTGRSLQVVVDAAPAAADGWSEAACAQPLAIEVACGRDRLIANAGWSPDAAGPQGLRLTAAGCTATLGPGLGEGSTAAPLTGWRARALGARLVGGPARVEARRNENEAGVWVELAHDGWLRATGLLHERRLYIDAQADELRGEDRFTLAGEGGRGPARRGTAYAIHFHLPPTVKVSLARDRRSVLLRGPSNRGWWLRNDAAEVALEPSVHFDRGLPRRSVQVVLRGAAEAGTRVRWKLAPVEPEPGTPEARSPGPRSKAPSLPDLPSLERGST